MSESEPSALRGTVAVVGAGTMGSGIALVAALAGHRTLLIDAQPGVAENAVERLALDLKRLVTRGHVDAAAADRAAASLLPLAGLDELAANGDCALVIEAVVEDLAVKQELFVRLERVTGEHTLLATNTSSLSVTAIARPARHPGRVLGLHFFNPVPRMQLVEVVTGLATRPDVIDVAVAAMREWGKTPVRVRSTPGFIVNRIARPFYSEALHLIEERAADPATLDTLVREAGGFRMGPLELTDLIGQEVNSAVTRGVWAATGHDPKYTPSIVQTELVDGGRLGRKSGRGFYEYGEQAPPRGHRSAVAPGPVPARVVARGDLGPLAALLGRGPIEIVREDAGSRPGFVELPSGAAMALTDGALAGTRAGELGRPVILIDRCLDPAGVRMLAAAVSDGAPSGALAEAAGVLAGSGIDLIAIKDVPGLVVARTVAMLVDEAFALLDREGAAEEDIDAAMRLGVNYPMGPFAMAESWGHGTVITILENLAAVYGNGRHRVNPLLRRRWAASAQGAGEQRPGVR